MGLLLGLSVMACDFAPRHVEATKGLSSFRVHATVVPAGTACPAGTVEGSEGCPLLFPMNVEPSAPVSTLQITVEALDSKGLFMPDYTGPVTLDVQPGRFLNHPAVGLRVNLENGRVTTEVQVLYANGPTRVWAEDCGTANNPGTFASGVTQPIWYARPTLPQLNLIEDDNTTSPLVPKATNACAIAGDPRFGTDGSQWLGHSFGGDVDAPPAAIGSYVQIEGCSRADYDAGSCTAGPLVVTGVSNQGFFLTDIHPDSVAAGSNHTFVFNFGYPEDLHVDDMLLWIRGSPVEYVGSTQLDSPLWARDPTIRAAADFRPAACHLKESDYRNVIRGFGQNVRDGAGLIIERSESGVVCVDNLAPATEVVACDVNGSGNIERGLCRICEGNDDGCYPGARVPPLCSANEDPVAAPVYPGCSADLLRPTCIDYPAAELDACRLGITRPGELTGSSGYFNFPGNVREYCCERSCYLDRDCVEQNAYVNYGQWVADMRGRYTAADGTATKIALITRDARPDFDPLAFGRTEKAKTQGAQTVRVMGNLRHVLAARPVWVVIARDRHDVVEGATCAELNLPSCF